MRIIRLLSIIICISIGINISAQSDNKFTGSLLWEVSGNGLKKPSYIFGTHHVFPISFLDSIPKLKEVLDTSEQVVGEIIMEAANNMQKEIMAYMMMPFEKSYSQLLSREQYDNLDKKLQETLGAGMSQFSFLKPNAILTVYILALYQSRYPHLDTATHEGMDSYVQRIANENGKSVIGLETMQEQMNILFNSTAIEQQLESLMCNINILNQEESFIEIEEYYRTGNLTELRKKLDSSESLCPFTEAEANAINKDRNEKWVQKLPGIMKEKSTFIAVGCMHLAGKDGILYQLTEKGYTIRPVK